MKVKNFVKNRLKRNSIKLVEFDKNNPLNSKSIKLVEFNAIVKIIHKHNRKNLSSNRYLHRK